MACGGAKNDCGSIYKTNDGGETWIQTYHSDTLSINDVFYLNDSIVYACGDSLMILKSVNGGNNWQLILLGNGPLEDYRVPYNCIYAINENNIFAVGGEHFNKGLWSETETGNYPWTHDSYDNQFNSICFVSEFVGFFGGYGILIVTEDGGNTFDYIDLEGTDFVDLEKDKYNTVYALSENGMLFSSTDLGYNWNTEINISSGSFKDIHFGDKRGVICGLAGLIFTKEYNNHSWSKADNIPNYDFYSVFVKSSGEIVIGAEKGKILILNKKRIGS